jgi:hypothetical protein
MLLNITTITQVERIITVKFCESFEKYFVFLNPGASASLKINVKLDCLIYKKTKPTDILDRH